MRQASGYVVDASVGVKLFVPEEHSGKARQMLSDETLALHVPDLFFVECANVFWKKVQRGEYDMEDALRSIAAISIMDLQVTSTARLSQNALRIADSCRVSAYDACYAALSSGLGLPLLTADARLAVKLKETGHQVIELGEL